MKERAHTIKALIATSSAQKFVHLVATVTPSKAKGRAKAATSSTPLPLLPLPHLVSPPPFAIATPSSVGQHKRLGGVRKRKGEASVDNVGQQLAALSWIAG